MSTPKIATRSLPDLWVMRTPEGTKICRRDGDTFVPARSPWIGEQLALLRLFVVNDFRARYRAQALGVVWSLIQPLVMMGILSLVFTKAFRSTEPHFPVFLLIGLLVWQWVSAALNASTYAFMGNADMVKRTVFPRMLLPLATVLSYGINAGVESIALLALIPFFPGAFHLSWALLGIVPLLLCLVVLLGGAVLAISVLNVIYRDVAYLVSTSLLLLYWLTPIVYPPQFLPEPWRALFAWNPLYGIITGLREMILQERFPDLASWGRLGSVTLLAALVGVAVFRRQETEMLDHV
jgi:ABC-type polysaccharide/polyol phosphate export permease